MKAKKGLKNKKRFLSLTMAMLAALSVGSVVSLTGCGDGGETSIEQSYETNGEYYLSTKGGEYTLSLLNGECVLVMDGTTKVGTYKDDPKTLQITFADKTTATATLAKNTLTLAYNNSTYTFYSKVEYTVTFSVDGATETAKVMNGKTAAKPADPAKDGKSFAGWYTDATFSTPFIFETTAISADITLYGKFVEAAAQEYQIDYVVDGVEYATAKTAGGAIYQLPVPTKENATFVGWWRSDYQDAEKLTAKVEMGESVKQSITLYAVWESDAANVSVTATGASWTAKGVTNQYTVKIYGPNNEELVNVVTPNSTYDFDFEQQAAGEYVVEITVNGASAKAYYCNKRLNAVSGFAVNGTTLTWDAVENATSYIVSYVCGGEMHAHENITVTETSYDFSGCPMKEDGIVFTVQAIADGHTASQAATYTVLKSLDQVAGLAFDEATGMLTWNAVENATNYVVEINGQAYESAEASFDVKGMTGELVIKVTPTAFGYNAPAAAELTVTKVSMSAPTNVKLNNSTLTWSPVAGATGYIVKIDDKEYSVTEASFDLLTADNIDASATSCNVSVKAVGATESNNSQYSDPVKVGFGVIAGGINYTNGKVVWGSALNVKKYEVQLNEGEIQEFDANTEEAAIVFTQAGKNVIKVRSYDNNDTPSEWMETEVEVYEVSFNFGPSFETAENVYVANGDNFALPTNVETTGYTFNGWFDAETNGMKYNKDTVKFEGAANQVVYASYTAKQYTITYEYTLDGKTIKDSMVVTYDQPYTLPNLSELHTEEINFGGWWSDARGQGVQYTDVKGNSLGVWKGTSDITLYGCTVQLFKYELITTAGGLQAYSVLAGEDISEFKEVKIPAMYNGLPVAWINADAFSRCASLETLYIPDSIEMIYLGLDGAYQGAGSAFYGCSSLNEVHVYDASTEVDFQYPKTFASTQDGSLVRLTDGGKELVFVSPARTGEYVIEDGVTSLAINLFKGYTNYDKIVVPASVTRIEDGAFRGCSAQEIIFQDATEEGVELSLGENVFYLTSMETFNIPVQMGKVENWTNMFYQCKNLKSITASEGHKYYSSRNGMVYDAAGETLLHCPRGVSGVVEIPHGTKSIATEAFGNVYLNQGSGVAQCNFVTGVIIPATVTEIQNSAFEKMTALSSVEFKGTAGDALMNIGDRAFYGTYGTKISKLTLPENTGSVGVNAFGGITSLTEVTINAKEGFTIADGAFGSTDNEFYVSTLNIGEDVPEFNINGAFGPTKLANLVFITGKNKNMQLIDNVLFDKVFDEKTQKEIPTRILYYPTAKMDEVYEIPSTVTSIGGNVFNGKSMIEIKIPYGVTEIGENAFANCRRLETVTFMTAPEDAEKNEGMSIAVGAFQNSPNLTNFTLPSYVTTIGDNAFNGINIVGKFKVPEGVTSIGDNAFANNVNLTDIELPSTLAEMKLHKANAYKNETPLFSGCVALQSVTVADGNEFFATVDGILYQKTNGVADQLLFCPFNYQVEGGKLVIPNTVRTIVEFAFYNNTSILEIDFEAPEGDDVPPIDVQKYAFANATSLTKATLGSGVAKVNARIFYGCTALTYVFIPNTVTEIAQDNPFGNCSVLTDIIFEEGNVTNKLIVYGGNSYAYTGSAGFGYCTALKTITFPERLETIYYYAFIGCDALEEVYLPSTLKTIQTAAFENLPNLHTVEIAQGDGSVPLTIVDRAFGGTAIKNIELPARTVKIGGSAFKGAPLEAIEIPENVTSIGANAFQYCENLQEVTFAGNLATSIGNYAFASTGLKSFNVPASVETVGQYAFAYTPSLTSVTFDTFEGSSNLKKIDAYAFKMTNIESLEVPESVNDITLGASLFQYCNKLDTVTVSSKVVSAAGTFLGCGSLSSVVIKEGVTNPNFKIEGAMIYNANGTAIQYIYQSVDTQDGVYRIADGITEIGASAFKGQVDIKKLYIPSSVTTIAANAFQACVNLEEVIFENVEDSQMQTLGNYAFADCPKLKTIYLPNSTQNIGQYAFFNCSSLSDIEVKGVTTIDRYAFQNCTSLKSIELNAGLTTLGTLAFANSGLTSINLPATLTFKSVTSSSASNNVQIFKDCKALENVTIADGLVTLGYCMFEGCTALKTIDVPESVSTFGYGVFKNSGLVEFTFTATNPKINNFLFNGCADLEEVILPSAMATIPQGMFQDCKKLGIRADKDVSGVIIPETVTAILMNAFNGCSSLKYMKLPDNLLHLGKTEAWQPSNAASVAFQNCTSLERVTLSENFVNLGGHVFNGCTSLTTIENVDKIQFVGSNAFSGTAITSIELPQLVTLNSSAFRYCENLSNVVLGNGVAEIPSYAFADCPSLKSIELPEELSSIDRCAFLASGLESISIARNVNTISEQAFADCASLAKVEFEGAIITIEDYAFANCTALADIELPETLMTLGAYAFGNTKIKSVALSSVFNYMGAGAFAGCNELTTFTVAEENPYYTITNGVMTDENGECIFVMSNFGATDGKLVISDENVIIAAAGQAPFYGNAQITEVVVTAAWTEVPANFFSGMKALKKVTLPATVETIGEYAFADATALENVVMSSGVKTIGNFAFNGCTALTAIKLPDTLESIGDYAFTKAALTAINVPSSVKTIGEFAFYGLTSLTNVTLNEGLESIGAFSFYRTGVQSITFPASLVNFGTSYNFDDSDLVYEGPGEAKTMGLGNKSFAFADCANLETVVFLGEDGKEMDFMFWNCKALKNVTLPSKLTMVDDYMFEGCTALEGITIPETVKELGGFAFANSGLKSIKIPASVKVVGTPIVWSSTSTSTDAKNNPYVTGRTEQSDDVKATWNYPNGRTFLGCVNLETVEFAGDVATIGWGAFQDCTSLKNIVLPETVEIIGDFAFANCTSLTKLNIPESVLFIGNNAFENAAIEAVVIPKTTVLYANVFAGWTNAQQINVKLSAFKAMCIWNSSWYAGSNAGFTFSYVAAN